MFTCQTKIKKAHDPAKRYCFVRVPRLSVPSKTSQSKCRMDAQPVWTNSNRNLNLSRDGVVTDSTGYYGKLIDARDRMLTLHYHVITQGIRPHHFYSWLRAKSVFSLSDQEEVESKNITVLKAGCLIDVIRTKGPNGFVAFLEVIEFEYPFLFNMMTLLEPRPPPKDYHHTDSISHGYGPYQRYAMRRRRQNSNSASIVVKMAQELNENRENTIKLKNLIDTLQAERKRESDEYALQQQTQMNELRDLKESEDKLRTECDRMQKELDSMREERDKYRAECMMLLRLTNRHQETMERCDSGCSLLEAGQACAGEESDDGGILISTSSESELDNQHQIELLEDAQQKQVREERDELMLKLQDHDRKFRIMEEAMQNMYAAFCQQLQDCMRPPCPDASNDDVITAESSDDVTEEPAAASSEPADNGIEEPAAEFNVSSPTTDSDFCSSYSAAFRQKMPIALFSPPDIMDTMLNYLSEFFDVYIKAPATETFVIEKTNGASSDNECSEHRLLSVDAFKQDLMESSRHAILSIPASDISSVNSAGIDIVTVVLQFNGSTERPVTMTSKEEEDLMELCRERNRFEMVSVDAAFVNDFQRLVNVVRGELERLLL